MPTVKKIVRDYSKKIQENNKIFSDVYLFGSHIRGNSNKWSDIDIAVVANVDSIPDDLRLFLWKARRSIDLRIEPHVYTKKDFNSSKNIIANEIKKTGMKIL